MEEYIRKLLEQVRFKKAHKSIEGEIRSHIEDQINDNMGVGMDREEAEKAANKGEAEIIIAKHRNGPVGTVKLLFQGSITKFKNPMKTDVF